MSLHVVPASREDVARFISATHRHHRPSPGDIFRLGVVDDAGIVRGVAQCGRPVARMADDGWTVEVNRVATDGAKNACSILYGAARRVAFTLGYRRIITYTLPEEGGASLRAAGWIEDGEAGGGAWVVASQTTEPGRRKYHYQNPMVLHQPSRLCIRSDMADERRTCTNPAMGEGDPMTPSEIDELERLYAKATPGPWTFTLDDDSKADVRGWREVHAGRNRIVAADWYERRSGGETETVSGVRLGEPNAAAIVALHNAAPALIAAAREVERLRAARESDPMMREAAEAGASMVDGWAETEESAARKWQETT